MPQLAEVIAALEGWFDPAWAEPWDAVGLTCGDPDESIDRVLLAVDVVPDTVAEAKAAGAQLLLTHHPLLLGGVHAAATTTPKGRLVHDLIRAGIAHYAAHTNADVADPGVSDALADRLGLTALRPLDVRREPPAPTLVAFVPTDDADHVVARLGQHAWTTIGVSELPGEREATTRVETVLGEDAVRVLREAGLPFDVYPQAARATTRGTGRIGELPATITLREFATHAARALPGTSWGVRAAGDPDRPVRTVAVCGGSGAPYADAARAAGADAYLTADLKHHATLEAVTERGRDAMALVDAAHWATEAPWLDAVAARLAERFGTTVGVTVSTTVTDPWTLHIPSPESSAP